MPSIRPPAVAGAFYPGEPQLLQDTVRALLKASASAPTESPVPKALIVPHAGYIYSGATAAAAYNTLTQVRERIRRVVLLGPVHRVPVRGLALPGTDAFETPLGRIDIDRDAVATLRSLPQVVVSEPAHAWEHSLEVQLPFLQAALANFTLVPLAVGDASADEVAEVLETLWGGAETLVVISSDLSHFRNYQQACTFDRRTVDEILAGHCDLDHEQACGGTPINGLQLMARRRGLRTQLLDLCNSGDVFIDGRAGDKTRVVGYAAFALFEPPAEVAHDRH